MAQQLESDSVPQPVKSGQELREDKVIASLLKRQDSVLEQLDALDSQIEAAIEEIGKARQEAIDQAEVEQEAEVPQQSELPKRKAA